MRYLFILLMLAGCGSETMNLGLPQEVYFQTDYFINGEVFSIEGKECLVPGSAEAAKYFLDIGEEMCQCHNIDNIEIHYIGWYGVCPG